MDKQQEAKGQLQIDYEKIMGDLIGLLRSERFDLEDQALIGYKCWRTVPPETPSYDRVMGIFQYVAKKQNIDLDTDLWTVLTRIVNFKTKGSSDKQQEAKTLPKYGTIVKGFMPHESIGSGDIVVYGNTLQYVMALSEFGREPVILFNDKRYVLSWDDIAELAEQAGLFDESGEV